MHFDPAHCHVVRSADGATARLAETSSDAEGNYATYRFSDGTQVRLRIMLVASELPPGYSFVNEPAKR